MSHPEPKRPAEESPEIDEAAWNAWLQKGRKQDYVRSRRLRALIYVFIILAACAVIWVYLPFSQRNR
jgi:hypothetical protein